MNIEHVIGRCTAEETDELLRAAFGEMSMERQLDFIMEVLRANIDLRDEVFLTFEGEENERRP
mgnify:CR=1 FL=1